MPIGRAVEFDDVLHAQGTQDGGDGDTANRVDAVDSYGEVFRRDGFFVHQRQIQHILNVVWQVVFLTYMSQYIHFGEGEVLFLSNCQHTLSLCVVEKFALLVEQFQCVPLLGVV